MAIEKHSLDGKDAAIYGETANINYFLKTALTPDSAEGVINKQVNVKAHSRRSYPGDDTPASVGASTRDFMYDPGRRNGAATPGQEMILDDGIEKRCFTYTGPWADVHSFLVSSAKMDLSAYSASARYIISAAGEQVAAVKGR